MNSNIKVMNIEEIMDIPKDYYIVSEPKLNITKAIKEELDNKNLSIRGLAKCLGMKHPQIIRVLGANNYKIDTLAKIIKGLEMELIIQTDEKEEIRFDDDFKAQIAYTVEKQRKHKDLSQSDLALKSGLHRPQIAKITNCKGYTIDTLLKTLNALNLDLLLDSKVKSS
ncbi:helix-turn-helix transcriptional regulator [Bacillus mexicanus]|uniref:helix-turn-helix transcriptional regulator n=1 Tax=Bacillus mexicanus TaxID=2834415 RepID=UPI003D2085C6